MAYSRHSRRVQRRLHAKVDVAQWLTRPLRMFVGSHDGKKRVMMKDLVEACLQDEGNRTGVSSQRNEPRYMGLCNDI